MTFRKTDNVYGGRSICGRPKISSPSNWAHRFMYSVRSVKSGMSCNYALGVREAGSVRRRLFKHFWQITPNLNSYKEVYRWGWMFHFLIFVHCFLLSGMQRIIEESLWKLTFFDAMPCTGDGNLPTCNFKTARLRTCFDVCPVVAIFGPNGRISSFLRALLHVTCTICWDYHCPQIVTLYRHEYPWSG